MSFFKGFTEGYAVVGNLTVVIDRHSGTAMITDESGCIPNESTINNFMDWNYDFYRLVNDDFIKQWNEEAIEKVKRDEELKEKQRKMIQNVRTVYEKEASYVYVVRANKYYKIGFTINLQNRFKHLQTSSPIELEKIAVLERDDKQQAMLQERKLHEIFKKKRHHGEWFLLDENDIEFILSLPTSQKWCD